MPDGAVNGLYIVFANGDVVTADVGDSGEELGEGSVLAVTEAVSKVDIVVVGDEFIDSNPGVATLGLCPKAD